jgi:hypothetical protein
MSNNSKSGDEGELFSFISCDDIEPRLAPRLSRFPAPFDFPVNITRIKK